MAGGNENRRTAAQRNHFRVGNPVRCRDDDFIACIHRSHEGVEKNLLSTRADNRLLRLVIQIVLALELFGNRLAQFRNTGNRRVLRFTAVDRLDGGLLDVVRRVEIRLASAKADYVAAFGLEVAGFLRDGNGGRGLYAGKGIGEEGHDVWS